MQRTDRPLLLPSGAILQSNCHPKCDVALCVRGLRPILWTADESCASQFVVCESTPPTHTHTHTNTDFLLSQVISFFENFILPYPLPPVDIYHQLM
jgi:hypothetical protein